MDVRAALVVVQIAVVAVRWQVSALVVAVAPAPAPVQVQVAILASALHPVYIPASCAPLLEEGRIGHTLLRFDTTPSTSGSSSLHQVQSIPPSRSNIVVCHVSS